VVGTGLVGVGSDASVVRGGAEATGSAESELEHPMTEISEATMSR
jgi:hypothetical protein